MGEGPKSSVVKATPTPAVPTGLSATAGEEQVELRWTPSADAAVTAYKIRQTVDSVDTEIDVSGRTTATYTVRSLTAGKSYTFTIAAVAGSSTESAESTATSAAVPTPPAASGLTATVGVHRVRLRWTASSTTEVTGYTIRQTVDGTETEIDVTGRTTATYVVRNLIAGKSYTFTIAAVAGSAESVQSSPTSAAVPRPAAVTGLSAAAGTEQVVTEMDSVCGYGGNSIQDTADGGCQHNRDRCNWKNNGDLYSKELNCREELYLHHSSGCRQHRRYAVFGNKCGNTNGSL